MLTDNSLMLVGRYKGERLANLPAWYLLSIYDGKYTWVPEDLRQYISANYHALELEKARNRKNQNK